MKTYGELSKPYATVIVNPISRSGLIVYQKLKRVIDEYFIYRVCFTKERGHASELARNAQSHVIIVCGGDGTINEVVNGIVGRDDIAIAPTYGGSGCDVSRMFGVAKKIEHRIREIYDKILNQIDKKVRLSIVVTQNTQRYFVGVGDAGFGAMVANIFDKYRKYGKIGYILGVFKTLHRVKPALVNLLIDAKPRRENILMVMFARSKYYAGGMKVSPLSNPYGHTARVVVLRWMKKIVFLLLFPKVYFGTHIYLDYVDYTEVRRVDIITSGLPIDVEGEYVGLTPCSFMVTDQYVRFV